MTIAINDLDAAGLQALSRLRLAFRPITASTTTGEEHSKLRGRSSELIDFRHYIAGDDPRDIDWNAVARHDELYTRIYAQEIAQPIEIYLDTSPSMRWGKDGAKMAQATTLAIAIAAISARSGASARIFVEHHAPILHRRGRSLQATHAQLATLELADECQPIDEILLARALRKKRALIVIISDGYELEALSSALSHLRARGHGLAFLQVLSSFELSPHLEADHTLVADQERVRVSGNSQTLGLYAQRLQGFLEQWRREMARLGAPYGVIEAGRSLREIAVKELPLTGLVVRR